MLTIEDFYGSPSAAGRSTGHPFGVAADKTAAALRALAARIDAGDASIRSVTVEKVAHCDDFLVTALTLRLCERAGT